MRRLLGQLALFCALAACAGTRPGGHTGTDSNYTGTDSTDRPRAQASTSSLAPAGAKQEGIAQRRRTPAEIKEVLSCPSEETNTPLVISEPGGPKRYYSLDGYVARWVRIERSVNHQPEHHCVLVAWPPGKRNTDGQAVRVSGNIHDAWLRGVKNTLLRVPWHHARLVHRLVIDNRPTEHGIAAFDRRSADDSRDGRTIWLHEHLFRDRNHWARGNHGMYWSYHVNQDGRTLHTAPADHGLFSPVLLHEIGHLVMYHLVNRPAIGIAATSAPACATTCGETGNCLALPLTERERGCISPYCMPFRFRASTENWAEQYRFYYQSSPTRALLSNAAAGCLGVLAEHDQNAIPPWQSGLPDMRHFRPSIWNSCGGKPCKGW